MTKILLLFLFGTALILNPGCTATESVSPTTSDPPLIDGLLGGDATTFIHDNQAFFQMRPNAQAADAGIFSAGTTRFVEFWTSASQFRSPDASFVDGVGPLSNSSSCVSCHPRNGRGGIFRGSLVRLSISGLSLDGGPKPEPTYGIQFQDRSVFGAEREGRFNVTRTQVEERLKDGTTVTLAFPAINFPDLNYGAMHADVKKSLRIPQALIGLGLLEEIPDEVIVAMADEADSNGDGISGKPNMVFSVEHNKMMIGRFGWKAEEPTLRQQVAGALIQDMGITNPVFPSENNTAKQTTLKSLPSGGTPELGEERFRQLVAFVKNIGVPSQRHPNDELVRQGRQIFDDIGCAKCHVPAVKTSKGIIQPYTDMLLHDMGESLADNRPVFSASGREWRTPPLWGLGLHKIVSGVDPTFLHDGRANSIEEAILWHGGEGKAAKDAYKNLPFSKRATLKLFLESL